MNLIRIAEDDLQDVNFMEEGTHLAQDYAYSDPKDFCWEHIPPSFEVEFTFIEDGEKEELEGEVIDKVIDQNERCLKVTTDSGDFLVPLYEIERQLNEFILDNLDSFIDLEGYAEDNYSHLKDLEDFKFLSKTKFGIEIEGGWNGNLAEKMKNFKKVRDTSFDIPDRENQNEFVYRGCSRADTVVKDLYNVIPALRNHKFKYRRTCGTHVHFSQNGQEHPSFDDETLLKTIVFFINIEDILFDIIPSYRVATIDRLEEGENPNSREGGYGKSIYNRTERFLNAVQKVRYRLEKEDTLSETAIERLKNKLMETWYGKHSHEKDTKYNMTRYYGINLHSVFYRGSFELRYFEGNYKNLPKYIDLIDKIMYLIENVDWNIIEQLLSRLDSYSQVSTKSCALLYALGVSNKTASRLLSRTDYTQLNVVKSHFLLNEIRDIITDKEFNVELPSDPAMTEVNDTTCYPEEVEEEDSNRKGRVLDKIIAKKDSINQKSESELIIDRFEGQDKDEFQEYLDGISQNIGGNN